MEATLRERTPARYQRCIDGVEQQSRPALTSALPAGRKMVAMAQRRPGYPKPVPVSLVNNVGQLAVPPQMDMDGAGVFHPPYAGSADEDALVRFL